jgi:Xaa-Pro aminopeptidase
MLAAVDVLIYGDTDTSPALRHELPLAIVDPFLYLEHEGRRAVVTHAAEEARVQAAAPGIERLLLERLGYDQMLEEGRPREEVEIEVSLRAARELGVRAARVPGEFPLQLADALRADGVALTPDAQLFTARRRRKSPAELDGIKRATDAALEGFAEAARILRESQISTDGLVFEGDPLTAEALRARIREVCARVGAPAPSDIIVREAGPEAPLGHDPGAGLLHAHQPIEIDVWPRDERSGCWSDMTRTFVRGEISDAVAGLHELVLEAHRKACDAVAPGAAAGGLFDIACDVFERAGHPTQRTLEPGGTLTEGFYWSLGHGVGLQVHEAPVLGRGDRELLVEGDVLAVEPGSYRPGVGATRVEDLLLVTDGGSVSLTGGFPHGLTP